MIELKYKTINNISPKNKPRVYFSCHKDDFKFFEEIANEILEKEDCAIYYLDDFDFVKQEDIKEYEFLLDQMNLFIFPITEQFLNSNNRSLQFDFAFAIKHKIPVLPLMYGEGLADLFKEKCGRFQYLNKFKLDNTAISYDKKLTDFLHNTLVSNEMAEKVRDAFDAYIFLSYRKKDRQYANEVMREIHKNKFARDIAIWFDEYLVPGENFTNAIEQAMQKSDLFALVVTPNLVNESNYVMNVEYPNAKKLNKKILPIESVETNKKLLKEKYDKIPTPVNINKHKKVSKQLLANLKKLALKRNDDSEHLYYIGLAYLFGIDVEVDRDKGIEYITQSAEEGELDAIAFLAEAYFLGNGVNVDFEKAIYWNLIACEISKLYLEDSPGLMRFIAQFYNTIIYCALEVSSPDTYFEEFMSIPYPERISEEDYKMIEEYKISSCSVMAISQLKKQNYDKALYYCKLQEQILNNLNKFGGVSEKHIEILIYNNFIQVYNLLKDFEKVLEYNEKLQNAKQQNGASNIESIDITNFSQLTAEVSILLNKKEYKKSNELILNFIKQNEHIMKNSDYNYVLYFYLSFGYRTLKQYDESVKYAKMIIDILAPNNNIQQKLSKIEILLATYSFLGFGYLKLGNKEKSDYYYGFAKQIGEETNGPKIYYYTGYVESVMPTGEKYVGYLENGYRSGKGKQYLQDGSYLEGEFCQDEFIKGTLCNADGTVIQNIDNSNNN